MEMKKLYIAEMTYRNANGDAEYFTDFEKAKSWAIDAIEWECRFYCGSRAHMTVLPYARVFAADIETENGENALEAYKRLESEGEIDICDLMADDNDVFSIGYEDVVPEDERLWKTNWLGKVVKIVR